MGRIPGYHKGLTLPVAGTKPQQWGFEMGRISVSLTREPGFRLGQRGASFSNRAYSARICPQSQDGHMCNSKDFSLQW